MDSLNLNNSIDILLDELDKNRYNSTDDTMRLGLKAYSLCKSENHEIGMAFALMVLGQVCVDTSNYEDAINYLFDSIRISQSQNICDLQMIAYLNIGNMYFDLGEYEKSFDYYQNAENLIQLIPHSKNYYPNNKSEVYTAKIKNNKGEIYRIIGSYQEAREFYNSAVLLEKNMNYSATFGMSISNMGNIEFRLGNYEKAIEYFHEAITYLLFYDCKIGLIEAYGILALVYEKKLQYGEAEKYFIMAAEISSEIDYVYSKIDILINFSNFLGKNGQPELAMSKLDEAYLIATDRKMYQKTMEICKNAIYLYENIGDCENANKYYRLYFENEKKLEPIELENRAKNLKMKIELDSLESEHKTTLEKSEEFRRKSEDLMEIIKNISIITELGEKITTTLDLNKIYDMLYNTIQGFIKASTFAVGLFNEAEQKIQYHYYVENNVRMTRMETRYDSETSMAVKSLKGNKIIVINDLINEYSFYTDKVSYFKGKKDSEDLNSAIFCPLVIDKTIIGVMTVQAYEKNTFTMLIVEMIRALSSYAAIAINNAIKSKNLVVEVKQRRQIQDQLEEMNNKLIYLSENDGLTNIPNRRKLDQVLKEEWDKAKENETNLSLIIFDIDYFKQYNDNFGHAEGDQCLVNISNELRKFLTEGYFAARYGGDEFVILLPDTKLDEAVLYGEIFRTNVENLGLPNPYSKTCEVVTITLGVSSVIPTDDIEIIDLIRQADLCLYKAKENGKNQTIGGGI